VSKTDLETALVARKTKQIELLPKVNIFLDSIARNSVKSKRSYSSGIALLQNFLNKNQQKYQGRYNCETILQPLLESKVNVYELFDSFISYVLSVKPDITPNSLNLYLAALRSYFAFYDIDVIPSKFRRKVKVPKLYREDEEPIDATDIRKVLLNCNNRRLKAYLLVLASGAMRAAEGASIRLKDIDFSVRPTKVHIRKEYTKTKVSRDVYITDEATSFLKQWIDWKYRDKTKEKEKGTTKSAKLEDLVFSTYSIINKGPNPYNLYITLFKEFSTANLLVPQIFFYIQDMARLRDLFHTYHKCLQ